MLFIPGGDVRLWAVGTISPASSVRLDPFLIDRSEVTNREFARFVTAGGYSRPELWKHPFRDGDRTLSFDEAMTRFRDATARPGPAGWRLGSHPDGEEETPVSGISWYEAAAFAEFSGKQLPTVYHWYHADTAGDLQLLPGLTLPKANYETSAPRAAAATRDGSAYGAIDMAGNLREWAADTTESGRRLTLGGSWADPSYVYLLPELVAPFDRSEGNGFRCIRTVSDKPMPEELSRLLTEKPPADFASMEPVSDEVFEVFTRFFERERAALEPRIESIDESSRHWIKQKVSYAAGYGSERMIAWLYLPRSAKPPYQVMIQMGGAATFYRSPSSATENEIFGWSYAESLIRGGRAVLLPIWKGSYERQDGFHPFEAGRTSYRDHVLQWTAEVSQSIDYLESREDVDATKVGYQGISFGATWAPLFLSLEPRLRTGTLLLGGLVARHSTAEGFPPEIQPFNYAPRVKAPVLMMNGRHDPIFPYETAQLPLFRLFGTLAESKRHLTYPAGHSTYGWRDHLDRELHDWLDVQFGPVEIRRNTR